MVKEQPAKPTAGRRRTRRDRADRRRGGRRRPTPSASSPNDFMFTGGDGYTALAGGTDVLQPGDALLDLVVEYITANSPVAPVVEGRIVRG
jgi:hypothetical protein